MVAFDYQTKAMLMECSVKLPYMRNLSGPIYHSAAPQRLAQIDLCGKRRYCHDKTVLCRLKAFALEVNPCGLHANYKDRCAGVAVIKNVKDCQIIAAIAVGQVEQNLVG